MAWALHANDTFDRDSPTMVDARGEERIEGLVELWRRVLSEGILDSGIATFTCFSLYWDDCMTDAGVRTSDNHDLVRMRGWIYGTPGPYEPGGAADRADLLARENALLLRAVAEAHERLLAAGARRVSVGYLEDSPAYKIRKAADTSDSAFDLQVQLATLA